MKETEFKTLMHLGNYVDSAMLGEGIYGCEKPYIYSKDETIEAIIERVKKVQAHTGYAFMSEAYFENLRKCELVTIKIIIQ